MKYSFLEAGFEDLLRNISSRHTRTINLENFFGTEFLYEQRNIYMSCIVSLSDLAQSFVNDPKTPIAQWCHSWFYSEGYPAITMDLLQPNQLELTQAPSDNVGIPPLSEK